jgi:hypothetical protein
MFFSLKVYFSLYLCVGSARPSSTVFRKANSDDEVLIMHELKKYSRPYARTTEDIVWSRQAKFHIIIEWRSHERLLIKFLNYMHVTALTDNKQNGIEAQLLSFQ